MYPISSMWYRNIVILGSAWQKKCRFTDAPAHRQASGILHRILRQSHWGCRKLPRRSIYGKCFLGQKNYAYLREKNQKCEKSLAYRCWWDWNGKCRNSDPEMSSDLGMKTLILPEDHNSPAWSGVKDLLWWEMDRLRHHQTNLHYAEPQIETHSCNTMGMQRWKLHSCI